MERLLSTVGRSRGRRIAPVALFVIGGLSLLGASVAWACTAQPVLGAPDSGGGGSSVSPQSGPQGTIVTVQGAGFQNADVSIRWNSVDGPSLGTARGPNFSTTVTVPPSSPAGYAIVAFQRDALGGLGPVARAPFQVTGDAAGSPGGSAAGSVAGSDRARNPGNNSTDDVASPATGRPAGAAAGAPSRRATGGAPPPVTTGKGPVGGNLSGAVPRPAPSAGTIAGAPAVSVPASEAAAERPRTGSSASVLGDLWSGYASGTTSSTRLQDVPRSDALPTEAILGVGLLGGGLVALFAGFLVTDLTRRRATVAANVERR
ncbi:MAG: IPT/TIG domain-containing protein [Candidatus Dormibacteria bacterium]